MESVTDLRDVEVGPDQGGDLAGVIVDVYQDSMLTKQFWLLSVK